MLLGASYDLSSSEFFEYRGGDSDGSGSLIGEIKDKWSLYLAPGYMIAPKTLFYGKLSIEGGKVFVEGNEDGEATESASKKFNGVGCGAGIRVLAGENVFVGVEVMRTNYSAESIGDANTSTGTTTGSIQIGYSY